MRVTAGLDACRASTTARSLVGRFGRVAFPFAMVAALVASCGAERPAANGDGTTQVEPYCGTPNSGCDCAEPGLVVDCGTVELRSGDYVSCSVGHRTCLAGKWGDCEGTNIVTKQLASMSQPGALQGLALGGSTPCPAPPNPLANPCDPYCNHFVDDPQGIVLGGGLTVTPGGVTVVGAGAPVACQKPADWVQVYAQYPAASRPNGAPPATCTAPAPDECSLDTACAGSSCSPRPVSASGACTGKDFTLGAPCWNGTRFTFQVCNRGTVAATSGILPIRHHTGSPSVAPSSCTMATNNPAGDCSIDLAAKPMLPGQCVAFTPTADCPLSVPNETGNHFYFVNQSNTGLPLVAGECNTCNNYTATVDTAKPPGVPGAACTAISCGGPGAAGGGQPATFGLLNGINTCAGSQDELTNPCNTGNPNKNCKQDFHCDVTAGSPTVNTCVWNQKTAHVDPACNGVDLTIGAGCNLPGGLYNLPICNRGTKTLAAGAVIKVGQANTGGHNSWNSSCAGGTPVSCTVPALTAPLGPGQCLNTTACPGGNGQRWDIVNADNSIVECGAPGAGCANNSAQVKDNGSGCQSCTCASGTAELTGRIMDPAKLRPVFGVTVYVPTTAVTALTGPNVQCDTCTNLYGGLPALASATTDVDGRFRLQGVPAGAAFPLVIQLGRFRRQLTVASIPACGTAALNAAQGHLPGTKTKAGDTLTDAADPDLPLIAMVTGEGDATECLLARMGIATSEFTAPTGTGAIHMYTYLKSAGLTGAAGSHGKGATVPGIAAADTLFVGAPAPLNRYNALILPCNNQPSSTNPTAAMQANLRTWLDAGGRLFASHLAVDDFIRKPAGNPNENSAVWSTPSPWGSNQPDSTDRTPNNTLVDNVNLGIPKGDALARWMQIAWPVPGGPGGAAPAFGKIPLPNYRNNVRSVNAPATSWFGGASTGPNTGAGQPQVNMMSFDAPIASPPASQCGRAVLPFMHVSSNSVNTFPAECGTVPAALTGQELSFEYMMWESMTCLSPTTALPTPPPPSAIAPTPPLVAVTFTRDYEAICPVGTSVEWRFFYWQGVIPGGTSIAFRAATASTVAALPANPDPGPATRLIGTASTSVVAPSWGQDARTVGDHLKNDAPPPNSQSQKHLRVYMTFNPSGGAAPLLQSWRQTYACVPSE